MADKIVTGICRCGHTAASHVYLTGSCCGVDSNGQPCTCEAVDTSPSKPSEDQGEKA